MPVHCWTRRTFGLASTSWLLAPVAASAVAGQSSFDAIVQSSVVRIGVIPNRPPYFWQADGEWLGFSAVMGRDLAVALGAAMGKEIKPEFVVTSWTTVVLDLQADKIDAFFGLSYSPEREKALALAGPMYSLPNVALDAAGREIGDKWEDYDKPSVKIAVVMGTTDAQAAQAYLPKAEIHALKGMAEAVLDVQSGHADALITTVLTGLGALKANRSIGKMVVLQPTHSLPSFAGTRRDGDGRFAKFLVDWALAYRKEGRSKAVIFDAMRNFGLDTAQLPPDVEF